MRMGEQSAGDRVLVLGTSVKSLRQSLSPQKTARLGAVLKLIKGVCFYPGHVDGSADLRTVGVIFFF